MALLQEERLETSRGRQVGVVLLAVLQDSSLHRIHSRLALALALHIQDALPNGGL